MNYCISSNKRPLNFETVSAAFIRGRGLYKGRAY